MRLSEDMTIREGKAWLRARLDKGEHCPLCTQYAKVYRRKITSPSARALVLLWRYAGLDFAHLPTVLSKGIGGTSGDGAKPQHWGLIEAGQGARADGGHAGHWRVTILGKKWIEGQVTLPKYARIYDGRCLGFEGDPTTIEDALGVKFDLRELLS
jgi:hypothetical protein